MADVIENQVIDEIHGKIDHINHLLSNPEAYVRESMQVYKEHRDILTLVFDSRSDLLISKIERELVERYMAENH